MTNVENVCEFSTPASGRAFHLNCGFRWHWKEQEPGPIVGIKINSGQSIDIRDQFQNGVYKGNGLEISFRGEKLKTCNYINIIMSINNTNSSISKYSISNFFDTFIGSDYHKASGLSGFRGWRGFDESDSHSVSIIFNNSQLVTPVSYARYSSYGYFSKEDPIDDKTKIQSTQGVSFSWEDREISYREVQEIRYSIGIGEYIVGYGIEVKTKLEKFYSPGSEISLNIDVSDNFIGDHLKITRIIDSGEEKTIYDKDDNGEHVNFDDNFTLPNSIGHHTIKYVTRNNISLENDKEVIILVNVKPVLTVSPNISTTYNSGEEAPFIATIYDDSPVSFIVKIDENITINETVDCHMSEVNKDFKLQLPTDSIGEQHSISMVCVDKFGIYSNLITKVYTTAVVEPPKIKVSNNISYLQSPYSRIFLSGEASYDSRESFTCFYTNIEKRFEINSLCEIIGASWTPFNISRNIPPVLGGIYILEIYASDPYNRRSDPIHQLFAVAIRSNCYHNYNDMFSLRILLLLFQFIISS